MSEQLAVMRNVKFGLYDLNDPALVFDTYIAEGTAALQVITEWDAIRKVYREANAARTESLEGRACWVEVGNGMIRFLRVMGK